MRKEVVLTQIRSHTHMYMIMISAYMDMYNNDIVYSMLMYGTKDIQRTVHYLESTPKINLLTL